MRVIDCMSGKVTEFNFADIISDKIANGLDHAVYRNGKRHTDWPSTRDDCEALVEGWTTSVYHDATTSVYTVAKWA
jgi:hypothetical protein